MKPWLVFELFQRRQELQIDVKHIETFVKNELHSVKLTPFNPFHPLTDAM